MAAAPPRFTRRRIPQYPRLARGMPHRAHRGGRKPGRRLTRPDPLVATSCAADRGRSDRAVRGERMRDLAPGRKPPAYAAACMLCGLITSALAADGPEDQIVTDRPDF